jgi:hypothetical protein
LDVRSGIDVGAEPAMAAYATAAAVLGSVEHPASDSRALISIDQEDDTLTVRAEVVAGGGAVVAADFVDIADRVGALGGQFTRSQTETGNTVVTAVIPCGS